jgi:hypothetical protein
MLKPNPPEEQKMWEILHRKAEHCASFFQICLEEHHVLWTERGEIAWLLCKLYFCLHNQMPEKVPQWRRHTWIVLIIIVGNNTPHALIALTNFQFIEWWCRLVCLLRILSLHAFAGLYLGAFGESIHYMRVPKLIFVTQPELLLHLSYSAVKNLYGILFYWCSLHHAMLATLYNILSIV